MDKPTDKAVRHILNGKYHLKMYRVRRSEWRRKLGNAWISEKLGTSDEFIAAWELLEKRGLLER